MLQPSKLAKRVRISLPALVFVEDVKKSMSECKHHNVTIQQDLSTEYVNVYQCSECGLIMYRKWSKSKGLGPLTLYKTQNPIKNRQELALKKTLNIVDNMRRRDREVDIDPLDQ